MEKLTETQQKVHDYLSKFSGSSIDMICTVTGINKLIVHKTVKTLIEKGCIKKGEGEDGGYSITETTGNVIQERTSTTKKQTSKTDDEVELKKEGRNVTKLKFNNELFSKNRLVLQIIRTYVKNNPKTTFNKLKEVFPDELQKKYGMFQEVAKAKKLSVDRERYFLHSDDQIILPGDKKKIAVCNQWTSETLPLRHFRSLGFIVK